MTYRAKPLTQRDGTTLQNANCRMTSIAVGLDYDTLGKKTSTGGKMRSFTSDQSGGTDSGDAKEAWAKGYGEVLAVRDGQPWSSALNDLKGGRLVHLDVWHATLGGPCVSGDGRYGHTVAVAPEQDSAGRWLVCDPWCKPGRWDWMSERNLRLGAEDWGSRVFNRATKGRATPLPPVGSVELGLILAAMARYLMGLYQPGQTAGPNDLLPTDTGGPPPIMYTMTAAHGTTGGSDVRFITATGYDVRTKQKITVPAGTEWFYFDGARGGAFSKTTTVYVLGLTDVTGEFAVQISTGAPYADGVIRPCLVKVKIKPALATSDICPPVVPPTPVDVYEPVGTLYQKKVT